jgi:hypothetical protein
MKSYTKISKGLIYFLLLFVLLSTAGSSEKPDFKEKNADDSPTSADVSSSPINADDVNAPENIDTADNEAADTSMASTDISSPLADLNDANAYEGNPSEDADPSVADDLSTSIDILSTSINADAEASEDLDAKDKEHGNPNPGIMPSNSKPGGLSYGEWNAEWWEWALTTPFNEDHPLYDNSPPPSTVSNEGLPGYDALFLGSSLNGQAEVDRDISISPGTKILIPLFNAVYVDLSQSDPDDPNSEYIPDDTTVENMKKEVDASMKGVEINFIEIDGKSIADPESSPSDVFLMGPFPEENVWGINIQEGAVANSLADGYYLLLHPLSAGMHEIHFKTSGLPKPDGTIPSQEVTYTITVEPGYGKAAGQKGNEKNKA